MYWLPAVYCISGAYDPKNVQKIPFLSILRDVVTFDWMLFCLLCDTPKQLEEGKLSVKSYQFSPEMISF